MPISIGAVDTITDQAELVNIAGANGSYDSFHPSIVEITNTIDFATPMMSLYMSGNVTIGETNKGTGKVAMLLLDTTSDKHTPTFTSNVKWSTGVTPNWPDYQHWQIVFQCINGTTVRATAVGFTSLVPPASMQTSFSVPGAWSTMRGSSGVPTSFHEEFSDVTFYHEPNDNRIRIRYKYGGSQTTAVIANVYVNYTGLENITSVQAMYNVDSQSCTGTCYEGSFGPTPADDGYNSGTYYTVPPGSFLQFGWMAKCDPNVPAQPSRSQVDGRLSDTDTFKVKVVDSVEGTFIASASSGRIISLIATLGGVVDFGGES